MSETAPKPVRKRALVYSHELYPQAVMQENGACPTKGGTAILQHFHFPSNRYTKP